MRELLLGHRSFPRNWLLFLAVGVILAQSSSWLSLSVPPIWLFARALPLFLRTARLAKNEDLLASGQAPRVEARSYRLYLEMIFQAAAMSGLLFFVHRCFYPGPLAWSELQFGWIYLLVSPLLHPLPIRRRVTQWLWLAVAATFLLRSGTDFFVPWMGFWAILALSERIKSPCKTALARRLNFAPTPSSDNPYEFRICRLLQRSPYSKLLAIYWLMSLYAFYAMLVSGEARTMFMLAPALGCGPLVLLGIMLYKERSARCYELALTNARELREGLSRPLALLGRNYCWSLAVAIQPLWLVLPHQATALTHLTCQLGLVAPLTCPLLAPAIFRAGNSKSPGTGFWLSMLTVYLLGCLPGMLAEGVLTYLFP